MTSCHLLISLIHGNTTNAASPFNLCTSFTALVKSPMIPVWNLVLRSTASNARSGLQPCTIQFKRPTIWQSCVCSEGTNGLCFCEAFSGGITISSKLSRVSEWVIKFYSLSRTADSEVHIVHISRVIIACTLKSLSSPHIDNTQSTSYK